jgi:hypothetical protein
MQILAIRMINFLSDGFRNRSFLLPFWLDWGVFRTARDSAACDATQHGKDGHRRFSGPVARDYQLPGSAV